jgi:MoaA/NifB/PqqE/SkfB family radical SAM enzyme
MLRYDLENSKEQLLFFNSIKEDYLYNFSLALNQPLIGPYMAQLVLTTKCNITCKMCDTWKTQEEELETFYVKKFIDDTYKLGNLQEVYLSGGEALLRPDIFTLIKYVKDQYPDVKTFLNTNGLLLTEQNIDKLIDAGLDILGISIDSPVSEIHNFLRGKGVLERAIEALNYINSAKKKKGLDRDNKFRVMTCAVLMNQTLDTMYNMLDFCAEYNICNISIQPYVYNGDFRQVGKDKFWIPQDRLSLLRDVLDKIESKREKLPLGIEVSSEKIYNYFSNPTYTDKCYAGFTRAILVGKKINFICNGPNDEKHQHFGMADKDSLVDVWYSEKANFFRKTIKSCARNCAQFCSIRPASDSITDIHQRLIKYNNLFLVFRELNFLKQCLLKYPMLPIKEVIESNFDYLLENPRDLSYTIKNVQFGQHDNETKQHVLSDLKLIEDISKSDTLQRRAVKSSNINILMNKFADLINQMRAYETKRNRLYASIYKELQSPEAIEWFPTYFCNSKCHYCGGYDKEAISTFGELLPYNKIIKIIELSAKTGTAIWNIGGRGGEPLFYPNLMDILEKIKGYNMQGILITNGLLLDEKFITRLICAKWDILRISLDSHIPDIHDEIRGIKGNFEKIDRALTLFRILKKENNTNSPNIVCCSVISNKNYKYITEYIEYCIDRKVDAIQFMPLINVHESAKKLALSDTQNNELVDLLEKRICEHRIKHNIRFIIPLYKYKDTTDKRRRKLNSETNSSNKFKLHCIHLWKTMVISEDGYLSPCSLIKDKLVRIKGSHLEAWNSEKINQLRRRILNGELIDTICKDCCGPLRNQTDNFNRFLVKQDRKIK